MFQSWYIRHSPSVDVSQARRDVAWKLSGSPVRGIPSHMKNFVRLVQFAWPYKVRFGLSIGCAAMVAILFFTELEAIYPLLHILFDSQNPAALDFGKDRRHRGQDPRARGPRVRSSACP